MRFSVEGVVGVTTWPDVNRVVHAEPTGEIIVTNLPGGDQYAVEVMSHGEVVGSYPSVDGAITIPYEIVADAFIERISLRLSRDGMVIMGLISFLPESETKPYTIREYVDSSGAFQPAGSTVRTDFVDITSVVDIVISGTVGGSRAQVCATYDDNYRFVKILIGHTSVTSQHITPDGSYKYIVACSLEAEPHSCILYF